MKKIFKTFIEHLIADVHFYLFQIKPLLSFVLNISECCSMCYYSIKRKCNVEH